MTNKKQNVVYGYFDSPRAVVHTGSESRVQHHQAEGCDMKTIIERFLKTGEANQLSSSQMQFIDATNATEYDKAQQLLINAQDAFYDLPSKIRTRFENDPRQFLNFMDDPQNTDEAVELGLAQRRPQKTTESNEMDHQKPHLEVKPTNQQA